MDCIAKGITWVTATSVTLPVELSVTVKAFSWRSLYLLSNTANLASRSASFSSADLTSKSAVVSRWTTWSCVSTHTSCFRPIGLRTGHVVVTFWQSLISVLLQIRRLQFRVQNIAAKPCYNWSPRPIYLARQLTAWAVFLGWEELTASTCYWSLLGTARLRGRSEPWRKTVGIFSLQWKLHCQPMNAGTKRLRCSIEINRIDGDWPRFSPQN